MEDMIQIRLVVERMKAEIVKAFDVVEISSAIKKAADKAVKDFDMKTYIEETVEKVFDQAREIATQDVAKKYGEIWSDSLSYLINAKIDKEIEEIKENRRNSRKSK